MNISDIDKINNRLDFAAFLGGLAEDFRDRPESWQCDTIDRLLEACAAWVMEDGEIEWDKADLKSLAVILLMGKTGG